ncbi:leucine-rich repeat domain-containing protein [Anatilimnocola floriformis]|uniref:leucine-rich repeat domain-containing protein n=1 Tax=Anatilimnocola floriformis TaxID=2948575 RepID=UPI0020C1E554|nr:hypothetical protein [Anatilimnocola floriformis]
MSSTEKLRAQYLALLAIVAAVCCSGCPSPEPKRSGSADPTKPQSPSASAKDDAAAIAALQAKGVTLNRDKAGNIGEVILSADCTNDDLKHVAALPHCTTLSAAASGISGAGLAHLKWHPGLKILRLEQSSIQNEDAQQLLEIPKLDDLDLRKTAFTTPAFVTLAKHKALRKIRAPQTKFDNESLKAIAPMKQLVALDLSDCELLTAVGCAALGDLPNLEMLKLSGSGIDDGTLDFIVPLKKLKVLGLAQSSVTKVGLDKLEQHPALKKLDLYGCPNVNSAALEKLGTIPNLETLVLRKTTVANDGMTFLAGLKNLRELDLSETSIGTGADFAAITAVQSLVDFNVWSTGFGDADMPAVGQLKNLERLNLDKTKVTDVGLESVQGLEKLEYIHLGKTTITDQGLAHLQGLKKLETVIVTVVPGVTDDGAAALKKAIPGVNVKR